MINVAEGKEICLRNAATLSSDGSNQTSEDATVQNKILYYFKCHNNSSCKEKNRKRKKKRRMRNKK
jgi:hypothetical protein